MGGENISLSIKHDQSAAFSSSGYTNLITNHTYIGGLVRQHGNLSFTRVFDAGHAGKPGIRPLLEYTLTSISSRLST
jgi:carboxypeptidase D